MQPYVYRIMIARRMYIFVEAMFLMKLTSLYDRLLTNLVLHRQLFVVTFRLIPQSHSLTFCFPTLYSESMDIDTDI